MLSPSSTQPTELFRIVGPPAGSRPPSFIAGLTIAAKKLQQSRVTRQAGMLVFLFVALTPLAYAKGPADEGFKKLTGGQIRAAFVGKTFGDGTHFSNRYKADGTIAGVSMGKKISNKWKIAKDTLCITDRFDELCYAVWIKGKEVKLVHEDSDVILEGSVK